jgi:stage II sporulation protein AB (anti-sigma F factor)
MCENKNSMSTKFCAISKNESFARNVVSCFALQLNPSLAEISDIKTAVSEAVTNAIVHGYDNQNGEIVMNVDTIDNVIHISVIDNGIGIDDVEKAIEPFYTTRPEQERSGMGFTIMQSFMDEVKVISNKGQGTSVYMKKRLNNNLLEAK